MVSGPNESSVTFRKRIVVSHEPAMNKHLEAVLGSVGYEVKTTTRPLEVLGLAAEFRPDVVLIKLIAEIDGLKLSEHLAEHFPKVRIIVLGPLGNLEVDAKQYLKAKGIECKFLEAPFSQDELLDVVESSGFDELPTSHP
jgi:FixJ family two-component response regulator